MRFLVYWALRRDEICSDPKICPHSEDGVAHGSECDVARIEELSAESAAGELLRRVDEIEFAIKAGFTMTLSDVTAEEFAALRMVQLERDRWQEKQRHPHGTQRV